MDEHIVNEVRDKCEQDVNADYSYMREAYSSSQSVSGQCLYISVKERSL